MCDHCGCRGVQPIGELMDEHDALGLQAHQIRAALSAGKTVEARALLDTLVGHLTRHVDREEDGIFRAIRATGEFVEEIDALEGEHRDLASTVATLDAASPAFATTVARLLDDLDHHIDREDLGIFPVSVVTLGATGWGIVDRAHERSPSFLLDVGPSPAQLSLDRGYRLT